jgi:hypothetical protein
MKRVFALIVLSVALVGCGDTRPESESESEKVNRALGGTEDDVAAFERWLDTVHPAVDVDIAVMKAFTDGEDGSASLNRLHRIGRDSRAIAQDVEGDRLRTFLVAYSEGVQGMADAYQAIVDAPADAKIKPLAQRLGRSKQRLRALDRKLLTVYEEVLPEDRLKELREHAKDVKQRAKEARGG